MKKFDDYTFGNSPAAVALIKLINESDVKPTKITKILTSFNLLLRELEKVNSRVAFSVAHSMYKSYKKGCEDLPAPFASYTANVLNTKYKCWLKANKAHVPYKNREDNDNSAGRTN